MDERIWEELSLTYDKYEKFVVMQVLKDDPAWTKKPKNIFKKLIKYFKR